MILNQEVVMDASNCKVSKLRIPLKNGNACHFFRSKAGKVYLSVRYLFLYKNQLNILIKKEARPISHFLFNLLFIL